MSQKRISSFFTPTPKRAPGVFESPNPGSADVVLGVDVVPDHASQQNSLQVDDRGPGGSRIRRPPASKFDIGLQDCTRVDDVTRHQLLTSPWRPSADYPFIPQRDSKKTRKFQLTWLDRYRWLSYSAFKEAAYCRVCVLFCGMGVGKGQHVQTGALVTRPFADWKHALETFNAHENTKYHRGCQVAADDFLKTFSGSVPSVIDQLDQARQSQINENRRRLVPIVETVLFCGRQGLPLRGHKDSGPLDLSAVPDVNEGNFRALLRMRVDCGDTALKNHLVTCPGNASYISPTIQNTIVQISADLIRERLVSNVNASRCFAILADETTDISGIEQLTICARYLNKERKCIEELFLGFVPVQDQTGRGLAEEIIKFLIEAGINMENLRGQGYDGASSMAGEMNGVQAAVREQYPFALYMHCASHALNLVLCAACSVGDIRNCFGTVKETAHFFRKSAMRSAALRDMIGSMYPQSQRKRLLNLCETRWVERHDALLSFVDLFEAVIATLEEIKMQGNLERSTQANNLLHALLSPSFLVSLHIAEHVLAMTMPLSKKLQAKDADVIAAINDIDVVQEAIRKNREEADESFAKIFSKVVDLATKLNVVMSSPRNGTRQLHRANSPADSPEDYYRRNVFIPFIDYILAQLDERFVHHRTVIENFKVIIPSMIPKARDIREDSAAKLVQAFSHDVDERAVMGELRLWWSKWEKTEPNMRPSTGSDALPHCDEKFYPNLYRLIQILATLPVTTASAERSFSSLRLLKNYLRSTMSEERLTGLALLYSHRDISISASDVIERFGKSRRRFDFII